MGEHKTNDKSQSIKTKWVQRESSATLSMNKILELGRKIGVEREKLRILKLISTGEIKTLDELVKDLENTNATKSVYDQAVLEQSND